MQGVIGEGDQTQMLSKLVSRVATLEGAAAAAEAARRQMHNQLVELRGNVGGRGIRHLQGPCSWRQGQSVAWLPGRQEHGLSWLLWPAGPLALAVEATACTA